MTVDSAAPARPATTADPAPAVSFWGAVGLVSAREISTKIRDRAFLISTVITLVLIVAAFFLGSVLNSGPQTYRVAAVGGDAAAVLQVAGENAEAADGTSVEVEPVADAGEAETLVRDGDVDAALVRGPASVDGSFELVGDTSVPGELRGLVARAATDLRLATTLSDLGADQATVTQLLSPVPVADRLLSADVDEGDLVFVLQFAFAFLFLFTVLTFGLQIAQSVTEEKQSRVVEILVAAVPVRSLLVGKVIGNTVLALGQLVAYIAVGLGAAWVAGQTQSLPTLTSGAAWFAVFFLLGFLMLAGLWAAAGALVSRIEDLGGATLPIQMLILIPYLMSFVLPPTSPVVTALSYIPFSSPLIMPGRLALGTSAWWEGLVALAVLAVAAVLFVVLAERIYRGSLLRTGARVSIGQAWRSAQD